MPDPDPKKVKTSKNNLPQVDRKVPHAQPKPKPRDDPAPKQKKARDAADRTGVTGDPWGDNWFGQVGDGTTTFRGYPMRAVGMSGVIAISLGRHHSIALRSDGTVWASGDNHAGQLGDGTTVDSATFVQVSGLTNVTAISAGAYHSLARKSDGTVWAWGYNYSGQLGASSTDTCVASPCSRTPIQAGVTNVAKISAAGYHSLAIKTDSSLWAWGYNGDGQLGDGTTGGFRTTPGAVSAIGPTSTVSGGAYHTVAIKSDGTVWSWGWNPQGQLGSGTTQSRATPAAISGIGGASAAAAGGWHSLVLKTDGTVWSFGANWDGQLGDGTGTAQLSPVQVIGWDGEGFLTSVVEIGAGWDHSVARRSTDSVWAWGWGETGALGDGYRDSYYYPIFVSAVDDAGPLRAVAATAGGFRSAAILDDGTLVGWGDDFNGELGLSTTTDRSTPRNAVGITDPISVAAGAYHSAAVRSDGAVFTWGQNLVGQLGDGTTEDHSTPVQISGVTNVTRVAAGAWHTVALKSDGTVWAWGEGVFGQLGDGTATDRWTPVQVSGLTNVTAIAAGRWHNLAIKGDGTVWGWGNNADGQLGDGSSIQRDEPVQIGSLTGALAVAGGRYHSLVIKSDGTVWAMGWNGDGQLGDGTFSASATPVRSGTLTGAVAIAAGGYHSVAAKSDGTAFAWGWNGWGQLGDGTTALQPSPAQVSGASGVTHVAAGWLHTHVRKSDGTVWGTGANFFGTLGDGSNEWRTTLGQVIGLSGATTVAAGDRHALVTPTAAGPAALPVEATPAGTDKAPPLINGSWVGISVIGATGALSLSYADTAIAGRGPAPQLTRTYNSNDTRIGSLGPGWTHSYDTRLVDPGDASGDVIVVGPQGRRDRYANSGGTFTPRAGVRTSLIRNGDGTYTATAKDLSVADFDARGRLILVRDRFGNASQLTYDPAGRLQSVSDPAGRGYLNFAYDANGRLTTVTDWINRGVQYDYDVNGRLARSTDREGGPTHYGYDAGGRLSLVKDPNGNSVLTVTYDGSARVSTQKDAKGLITGRQATFAYTATTTAATYPQSSFNGFNALITDTFDANGWLTRREAKPTSTETSIEQYTYSAGGEVTTYIDPRGNTTTYCWDRDYAGNALASRSNLTRVIAPAPVPQNPLVSLIKYDAKDNVIETVTPKGVSNGGTVSCTTNLATLINAQFVTTKGYDASGVKLLSVTARFTDPDSGAKLATTKYEYGDAANPGRITKIIPPRGNTGGSPDYTYAASFTYFATGAQAGMLQRTTDALGNATTYTYDAVGRRSTTVDPNGNASGANPADFTSSSHYDNEDRLKSVKAPAPAAGGAPLISQTVYDRAGNPSVSIDPNGQVKKYLYDERNLLRETQESPSAWADPNVTPSPLYRTTYTYDDLGLVTRVIRAAGESSFERATDTTYDGLGQLRREIQYPAWPLTTGSLTTAYGYDLAGNLTTVTDPLPKTTTVGYDPPGRLVSVSYTDGTPNVAYSYDRDGNRSTMVDGTGSTTYTVDELGRLTAVATPGPKTVGYRYDLDGNRTRIIYPDSTAVTYTFDKAGRLTSLSDWASRSTSYTYNPDSTLSGLTGVNATTASYLYDNARRVTQVTQKKDTTTISQNRYTLDAVGNRTKMEDLLSQVDGSVPSSWGHNDKGQLGDGTTINRSSPVAIADLGTVQMFAPGGHHSIALMPDGTLRSWGENARSQLGDGTTIDRLTPVSVTGLSEVLQISSGEDHTLARLRDGTVKSWGYNLYGQLGNGNNTNQSTAVTVSGLSSVTQVSGGGDHSLALKSDRTVWAWGINTTGELGDGTTTNRNTPVQVKGVAGVGFLTDIVYISGGRHHSLAVKSDGTVYAWGHNHNGQLGDGTLNTSTTPLVVKGPDGITPFGGVAIVDASKGTGIGGGSGYSIALKTDGTVWAWGDNKYGQLGDGTTVDRPFAVRVGGTSFDSVTAISAGLYHAVAAKADGTVWTWGLHDFGQLGRSAAETCSTLPCSTSPGQVAGLVKVVGIFTHREHTVVTSARFKTTNYGYDRLYRLLDDGTTSYTYDPVGNRASMMSGGSTTNYSYDRADRITAAGAVSYTLNAAGNLAARGSDTFTFNQANRLVSASVGGTTASYTYDGDGNRRSKTISGGTTNYVFDTGAGLPVLLDDGVGKYVWGMGLAYGVNGAGVATAVHGDALQSVRALTDTAGLLTQTYQRDAFGVLGAVDGSSTQPFDFTGELRDAETGFVYLRARMYDPTVGRFISRDDFAGSAAYPQTQNRYSYVGNNPVTLTDPTGRCAVCAFFGSAEAFAAAMAAAMNAVGSSLPIKLAGGDQWVPAAASTSASASTPAASSSSTRTPDYRTTSVSVGPVVVEHTVDRFGEEYYAVGGNFGGPFLSIGIVEGFMQDPANVPDDSDRFLTGPALTFSAGFGIGHGVVISPLADNSAYETGFYSPQVGIAMTWGVRKEDLLNWDPWPFFP